MGEAVLLAGEPARAAATFDSALAIARELGDLAGEAIILRGLGVAKLRQAQLHHARTALQRSRELAVAAGLHFGEARTLLALAELALTGGDPDKATMTGRQAVAKFQAVGARLHHTRALTLLSDAYAAEGDTAAARAASAEAATLRATSRAESHGSPLIP
ncbi:MAG TPA: hypothetical protein VMA72_22830 [Streptosporangiaceae bacterium]|nr:hypothetical protein [Streptosporangiaceae bacterium]